MKKTELLKQARQSSIGEISAKIADERKQLFILHQDKILGKLKNVAEIGQRKDDIARLMTILDEKVSETVDRAKNN